MTIIVFYVTIPLSFHLKERIQVGQIKDECGVFGIWGHPEASKITYLGLYSLQHRGQESAGIVAREGGHLLGHKGMGLVSDVFNEDIIASLKGNVAIGHVRYSTTGSSNIKNASPFQVEYSKGSLAIGHNGNIVNAKRLRDELQQEGAIFQSTIDSEVIVHLIARERDMGFEGALVNALGEVRGAFSLVILTDKYLIGARDPHGFRPLCLGKLDDAYVLASETCALDLIGAKYLRDIEPGEIVFIDDTGIKSIMPYPKHKHAHCIFEMIYFARPDSSVFGESVYEARKNLGKNLAKEHPVSADMVLPVPDSGNVAALGFAEQSKIPFELGIVRNHYIGRTFIQPTQRSRDLSVKIKLNPVRNLLKGKRVVIVEDSIVRGTTSKARVKTLKDAGAAEVHMRVSCPPIKNPCLYGIDFPTREELIASSKSAEDIRKFLGLDSLGFLSVEGMLSSMPIPGQNFCVACFTGDYPVEFEAGINKYSLEKLLY